MIDDPGTCFGGSRWCGGRSNVATGLVASTSRFTSQAQKLDTVDCLTRIEPMSRSTKGFCHGLWGAVTTSRSVLARVRRAGARPTR